MAPFRFVLLGTGLFARKWLEVLKSREDCEVVGIASRTSARAEALKRDFDLPGAAVYPGREAAVAVGAADGALITPPVISSPGDHPRSASRPPGARRETGEPGYGERTSRVRGGGP